MNKKSFMLMIFVFGLSIIVITSLIAGQVIAKPLRSQAAQAFTSGVLSYQGTLTDSLDNPVTGSVEITFRIYISPTEGQHLWEEVRVGANAVPVENGLFNVMLGSLIPIPASVWEQAELYLGIQIGVDSEMIPREKLTTVPSAAMANVAQLALTVPDGSITNEKIAGGQISSKNVGLTHGEIYGSGEVLYLSGIPQTIPSLSFDVNPSTPQVLQVSVTLDAMFYPNCSTLLVRVMVDDTPVGPLMALASYSDVNVRGPISTTRQVNLAPGSHSVSFKAYCEVSGAGSQIWTGQSSVSYLLFSQ